MEEVRRSRQPKNRIPERGNIRARNFEVKKKAFLGRTVRNLAYVTINTMGVYVGIYVCIGM